MEHKSLPLEDAWSQARQRYIEDLTEDEKSLFLNASAANVLDIAGTVQKIHHARRATRHAEKILQPLVNAITQYGKALDVFSNASPCVLGLLWGGIRVCLHVKYPGCSDDWLQMRCTDLLPLQLASEFGNYFDKLLQMFARISDTLPRLQDYEMLFPKHERLIHALSVVYVDILRFCADAKAVFHRAPKTPLGASALRPIEWQKAEHWSSDKYESWHYASVEALSAAIREGDCRFP
jgi:hypothetical protein